MVKIRMQRFGRTHRPFYRINAIDQRTRRNGRVLENLGHYDPMEKDDSKQIVLKEDRIKEWLGRGARPSETVRDMLGRAELLDDKMKKEWEADREVRRRRGECKKALKEGEAIVAEIDALAQSAEADLTQHVNASKRALNLVRNTVGDAKAEDAATNLKAIKDAKDAATKASQAAAPEPEPEAEGDAAEPESADAS